MIESVSRRAFSSSSGTYNVRASELARERKLNIVNVTVQFLDDTQHVFQIEKKAKGSVLLELVFQHIELVEKDYFGLQFTENGTIPNATNTEITRWLDGNKSVKKQAGTNAQFYLAVRFYPPEPSRLAEEFTRYLLCLQLRKLLLDGRMIAPKNTALLLASFTVQAEVGDYNVSEHPPNYLSELCLLPKQNSEDERRIRELHKLHKGQSPADAEANFLEHAKRVDCYGVESHPAKDYNGKDISIGVTSIGIVVFQNNVRVNTFSWGKIVKISFKKKQFFIQLKREPSESYDTVLGFNMRSGRAAKALWRCSVERHGFFRLRAPRRPRLPWAFSALAGIAAPAVPRTHSQALEEAKRDRGRSFIRRSSSRNRERSSSAASPTPPVSYSHVPPVSVSVSVSANNNNGRTSRVTANEELQPRAAWTDAELPQTDIDDGGFLERALRVPLPFMDESSTASEGGEGDGEGEGEGDGELEGEGGVTGAVVVELAAGPDERFGFNVRGGGAQPVLVSRVAPRTKHKLQEGDQVLSINGKDVEEMTHEQVVQMIRNTRGVLTLVVKPNAVYEPEDGGPEEPAVSFVPLTAGAIQGDALEQSMLLLGDGLYSGAALRQYETLLRRQPDESSSISKLPQNLNKNRYRDIAPYDSTRVILKNGPTGDYINASYINMEIPNSDLVLTYIATQGPLSSTVGDFWQMVWESESSLIVMLTVLAERGRAKCHQYWPKVGTTPLKATSELTVHTISEQNLGHYIRREMTLKESGGGSRNVSQLQYVAWPDHGVPEDSAAFISFTTLCSQLRTHRAVIPTVVEELTEGDEERLLDPPMIVHCSAGVGRTGALILAETALKMLARAQPLYPLDVVRAMREQRPMCIQNASQYKFVCESIQAAYAQGVHKTTENGAD